MRIDAVAHNGEMTKPTMAATGTVRQCRRRPSHIECRRAVARPVYKRTQWRHQPPLPCPGTGGQTASEIKNFIDVPGRAISTSSLRYRQTRIPILRREHPTRPTATFVGESTIDGLTAYEFVSEVPEIDQVLLATPDGRPALGASLEMRPHVGNRGDIGGQSPS